MSSAQDFAEGRRAVGGIGMPLALKAPSQGQHPGLYGVTPLRPEGAKALKLNFRMWFKNGLKAQKLLAQGIALGYMEYNPTRPERAKALKSSNLLEL